MLELKNISFARDNKKILDDVNLKLDSNKFIAITGPNGSGKSTLAKIIMGIEKPDFGKIIFMVLLLVAQSMVFFILRNYIIVLVY